MQQEIIIAGFGGQGIQMAGMLLAYAGMLQNKEVSFLPSYGPEMRGGTSNCHVIVSDDKVGSPVLNSSTVLLAMNRPSLDKFEDFVRPGGLIITDSSLVNRSPERKDVTICEIPATKIASDLGNAAFANIVVLGALLGKTGVISKEFIEKALIKVLPEKKHDLIPIEMQALEMGIGYS
jgi:2-oxoglutarate ferredoxin oxidoreductase subunit gamma